MNLVYKTQKRGQWLTVREMSRSWLQTNGNLPADALGEFKTKGNSLSVYELEGDRANLARVIAAILAGKSDSKIDHTDCLVFDAAIISGIGIRLIKTDGRTPDRRANSWHWDLAELTAAQLSALAEQLVVRAELVPLEERDLLAALRSGVLANEVEPERVGRKIREQLKLS